MKTGEKRGEFTLGSWKGFLLTRIVFCGILFVRRKGKDAGP
jgi:hypothetical protein